MKKAVVFFLLFFSSLVASAQVRKVVIRQYANGNPEVIYYLKGKEMNAEKIKEEVFYESGKMEYSGQYKNGVEHGEWVYYYENGNIKAKEYWKEGVENGVWKEYHPDGKLAREIIYKDGVIKDKIVK
ncbi:MAG: hypothetical protein K1X56_06770 [Flavobacteriales bacterium]|nr:hypothetical protein [Flavobacteriales bacterium]